jgi:hypothetical protein
MNATSTVTPTISPACGQQMITIYDARGEKVAAFCGSGNFPNGTSFSMTLSGYSQNGNGPGGTIAIYLNGQTVATWTSTDLAGNLVPDGFYHIVVVETTVNGNVILLERETYISTYHGEQVLLLAMPNIGHPGDMINFVASFNGVPGNNQSKIKIYATDGELIKSLGIYDGTASWDVKNVNGIFVASGVYIAVLDGIDPTSGQKLTSVKKILITH